MSTSIIYEDCDESGLPYAVSKSARPANCYPANLPSFCKPYEQYRAHLFELTGRKYFLPGQPKRWKNICKRLSNGKMPVEWLENVIGWLTEKNSGKLVITFSGALSLIDNTERMLEYVAKNKLHLQIERGEFSIPEKESYEEKVLGDVHD